LLEAIPADINPALRFGKGILGAIVRQSFRIAKAVRFIARKAA
jgi:hypothetical protein